MLQAAWHVLTAMATLPGPTPAPGIRPSWTWPLTRSVPSLLLSSWTMFFGPALEDGISSPDGASAAIDASARTATTGTRPYVRFLTILCRNPRGRVESEVVTNWETREQDTSPRRCPARYDAIIARRRRPCKRPAMVCWCRPGGAAARRARCCGPAWAKPGLLGKAPLPDRAPPLAPDRDCWAPMRWPRSPPLRVRWPRLTWAWATARRRLALRWLESGCLPRTRSRLRLHRRSSPRRRQLQKE